MKDIDAPKTVKVTKSNTQLVTCDMCGIARDRLVEDCGCPRPRMFGGSE